MKGAQQTRDQDLSQVGPNSSTVDQVEASATEFGRCASKAFDAVPKLSQSLVILSLLQALVEFGSQSVHVALPVLVRADKLLTLIIQRLDATLALGRSEVTGIVDGTVKKLVGLVDDALDTIVVLEVLNDLVASFEDVVKGSGERLDDLAKQVNGRLGLLVGLDFGRGGFGGIGDGIHRLGGVLANERHERVDGLRVLRVRLDLVDNSLEALNERVLYVGRQALVCVFLELLALFAQSIFGIITSVLKSPDSLLLKLPSRASEHRYGQLSADHIVARHVRKLTASPCPRDRCDHACGPPPKDEPPWRPSC